MSATATEIKPLVQSSVSTHNFIKYRTVLIVLSEIVLIATSYYLSFLLRLDTVLSETQHDLFWKTLPLVIVLKLVVTHNGRIAVAASPLGGASFQLTFPLRASDAETLTPEAVEIG